MKPGKRPAIEIPTEVKIWLTKGWKIIPSERRGFVIAGEKTMRKRDKVGFVVGALLLLAFFFGYWMVGLAGLVIIVAAWLDYRFNTKPPTKFFPEMGEKKRVLDR